MANEIEKVAKELCNLTAGFRKLHIIIQDIHDFRKEEDEKIEQIKKTLEEKKKKAEKTCLSD